MAIISSFCKQLIHYRPSIAIPARLYLMCSLSNTRTSDAELYVKVGPIGTTFKNIRHIGPLRVGAKFRLPANRTNISLQE